MDGAEGRPMHTLACPRCRFVSLAAERCERCGVLLAPRPAGALVFPGGGALFARVPPPGALTGVAALWLVALLGPWALLSALLVLRGPLTAPLSPSPPTAAQLVVEPWLLLLGESEAARRVFTVAPFARETALAALAALVVLAAAFAAWRRRRRRAPPLATPPGPGELLAPALLGLAPTLLAGAYALHALRPVLPVLTLPAPFTAVAPLVASGVAGAGLVLLAAAPTLGLALGLRWLRGRYGWCEVGADQVLFAPPAVVPWRLVVPKRDLGARRVDAAGVRVEVPGAGHLLVPTRDATESEEVLRRLDDVDLAADDEVPTAAAGPRRWPSPLVLGLVVGAPTLLVTHRLGLAWTLPALAAALAVAAPGVHLLLRWLGARADAARLHVGRDGLLAGRWIARASIRSIVAVSGDRRTDLAIEEVDGRRHLLRLGAGAFEPARTRLARWLGREVAAVQRGWATPRARRRALGAAAGACLAGTLLVAVAPWDGLVPVAHVVMTDHLGNSATLIRSPGAPGRLLLLGPRPRAIDLGRGRRLDLAGAAEGAPVLDLARSRLQVGEGPWVDLPAGARLVVVSRRDDGVEVETASTFPFGAWEFMHLTGDSGEAWGSTPLPAVLGWCRSSGEPAWDRFVAGFTSVTLTRSSGCPGDVALCWLVDHGRVLAVVGTTELVGVRRDAEGLELHRPWDGGDRVWRSGSPGRLLLEGHCRMLAFDGDPPDLERLLELQARVARGEPQEEAGRALLPFWDLAPPEGVSRRKVRALACSLSARPDPWRDDRRAHEPSQDEPEVLLALLGVEELLRSADAGAREAGVRAVLSASSAGARRATLEAVWRLLPRLTRLLQDDDPRVRAAAAEALLTYEPDALDALAPLLRADPDEAVRVRVLRALPDSLQHIIHPAAALRALRPLVHDPALEVRLLSQHLLESTLRSADVHATPDLVAEVGALLEDVHAPTSLRRAALEAVLPADREAVRPLSPALRGLLGRPDPLRDLVERAVHRLDDGCACDGPPDALCWLGRRQEEDGRWASPRGDHDVGVTALATLAFLAHGQTHRFGRWKVAVGPGLAWLRERQGRDGAFDEPPLDQALATQALCEAFATSRDRALRASAQAAVDALVRAQAPDGGWGSTLLTAHAVLALKSARSGGLDVPDEALARAGARLQEPGAADDAAAEAGLPVERAAALLGRLFTGERGVHLEIRRNDLPRPATDQGAPAYWYFATYAAFAAGHPDFIARWGPEVDAMLTGLQVAPGDPEQGSWAAAGWSGAWGGRTATTALNFLTREVHRRYERALDDGGR
ncbi:MAG: HEAT repeat domain-containing protein [Planctomycetes bacterium]|nr:HEAT repeat domain-containing protein [Planctomycetota bacterium]